MDETEMTECLGGLLEMASCGDAGDFPELEDADFRTFADDGVLTDNKGLCLRPADGSSFQITVVKVA